MRIFNGSAVGGAILALAIGPCPGPAAALGDETIRVDWLRAHSVPLRTIDPRDDDFSDLMPLLEKIGDARIVAMGEATHGDGSAFHAKARLVRFLHQVMGFDVLAWESPSVGCRDMGTALRAGEPPVEAARHGPFAIWSGAEQARPVFDYLQETQSTPRPILSAGFDARLWGSRTEAGLAALPRELFRIFDHIDPGFLSGEDRSQLREMVAGLDYSAYYEHPGPRRYPMEIPKRMRALLASDHPKLRSRLSRREAAWAGRLLDNLIQLEAWLETVGLDVPEPRPNRDVLMAQNLVWLAQVRYPDRKIMVWAHNYHVMASLYTLSDEALMKQVERENRFGGPMGMHVRRALGPDYYSIGFSGYAGRRASLPLGESESIEIPAAAPGTLDALLHETGHANLFLDLRSLAFDHWLRRPTIGRFYFWRPTETLWARVFDAVVFTDELFPTTPVSATAEDEPATASPAAR